MGEGERIRQLAENTGVSFYEISKETGISQSSLSRIVHSNTAKLSIKNLHALADYFGVTPEWIRTGQGKMLMVEVPHPFSPPEDFIDKVSNAFISGIYHLIGETELYSADMVSDLHERIRELEADNALLKNELKNLKKD